MLVWSLGQEDPLKEGMATHVSVLAWRIPWTKAPGGLESIRLHRVRHDWNKLTHTHTCTISSKLNTVPSERSFEAVQSKVLLCWAFLQWINLCHLFHCIFHHWKLSHSIISTFIFYLPSLQGNLPEDRLHFSSTMVRTPSGIWLGPKKTFVKWKNDSLTKWMNEWHLCMTFLSKSWGQIFRRNWSSI